MQVDHVVQEPINLFLIKGNAKVEGEALFPRLHPLADCSWAGGEIMHASSSGKRQAKAKRLNPQNAKEVYFVDASHRKVGGMFTALDEDNQTYYLINNGVLANKWSCKSLVLPFESPMVNWSNVLFQMQRRIVGPNGEDMRSEEMELKTVLNKTKPSCRIHIKSEKLLDLFVQRQDEFGFQIFVQDKEQKSFPFDLAVCQKGTLGELFDLSAWIASYDQYSAVTNTRPLSRKQKQFFRSLAHKSLMECFDLLETCKSQRVCKMLQGLLVGVPLELTFSILNK